MASREDFGARLFGARQPDLEEEAQLRALFDTLLMLLARRHHQEKQTWIELYWERLLSETQARGPGFYPWPEIPEAVKKLIKNHLLSRGYGVRTPPAPVEHVGILITWRFALYGRKE